MKKTRKPAIIEGRTAKITAVVVGFSLIGLALLLRSGAAPNPNLSGDLNGDNQVTVTDLSILLSNWNKTTDTADINKDGKTNITDLSMLLSGWGKTPTNPNPNPPGPTPNPPTPNPEPGAFTCDQAGIQKLVDSVSQARVEANLRELVQDNTKPKPNMTVSRHISQPGNKQKTTWMTQTLVSYGLTDRSQTFSSGGYSLVNPVGRINGTQATNLYAVGGHIDAIADDSDTVAPGADDDGSGVAVTIEAARVLYQFRSCLKASVDFIGFNDEEEDMKGSPAYIAKIDKTFKGLFNLDMVGTHQNGTDCVNDYYNSSRDKFMADKLQEVNTKYGIGLKASVKTYSSDDIDSWQFWNKQLPSTYNYECEDSPNYHQSSDQIDESISFTQLTKMTKKIVAAVAELSMQ